MIEEVNSNNYRFLWLWAILQKFLRTNLLNSTVNLCQVWKVFYSLFLVKLKCKLASEFWLLSALDSCYLQSKVFKTSKSKTIRFLLWKCLLIFKICLIYKKMVFNSLNRSSPFCYYFCLFQPRSLYEGKLRCIFANNIW